MYYEFYLDVYFLENLTMNFLVLQMTGQVIRRRESMWKLAAAALSGAVSACVIMVLPVYRSVFLSVAISFLCGCVMAGMCYGKRGRKLTEQAVSVFWILTFLLGGIWQFLRSMIGLEFVSSMVFGYGIVWGLWKSWNRWKRKNQFLYDITIIHHGKEVHIKALLDSGNQLTQPGTGKPVQIVEIGVIKALLNVREEKELESMIEMDAVTDGTGTFTYIPYHSIGKEHGILPLLVLDTVRIKHGESAWNTKGVLTAVSKTAVSSRGEYQMILHPQILE